MKSDNQKQVKDELRELVKEQIIIVIRDLLLGEKEELEESSMAAGGVEGAAGNPWGKDLEKE